MAINREGIVKEQLPGDCFKLYIAVQLEITYDSFYKRKYFVLENPQQSLANMKNYFGDH